MKKKFFIKVCYVLMLLQSGSVVAQLTVTDEGRVAVGPLITNSGEDALNVVSMSIYGKGDTLGVAGKLAFGDFSQFDTWGWNVFVGEYVDSVNRVPLDSAHGDTDKLWLHGKNGFNLTYGRGEYEVMSFDVKKDNRLHFNSLLIGDNFGVPAYDSTNVRANPLRNNLNRLLSLDCISFDKSWRSANSNMISEYSGFNGTNKQSRDITFFSDFEKRMERENRFHTGFDLASIESAFPELVSTDSVGNKYVDYINLIPIMVQAIQEQAMIISAYGRKIRELSSGETDTSTFGTKIAATDTHVISGQDAVLYQNTPNPFNTITEINYFLPQGFNTANIFVFNLQGDLQQTYNITMPGFGSVQISASQLNPGMYFYSLVVDGLEVETKKMILTQ